MTTTYTFSMATDDCENASIHMLLTTEGARHVEITEFYMRFLRACGFTVNDAYEPDINDLSDTP